MIYTANFESPIGNISLAASGGYIVGLWFSGQKYFQAGIDGMETDAGGCAELDAAKDWLSGYFKGLSPDPAAIPVKPNVSDFRRDVLEVLLSIPYGKTATYGEIAALLGKPKASRAVGSAVAHNPVSIIIPCHRVIGAGGKLTGYAGGVERKVWLLRHEGLNVTEDMVCV